MQKEHEAEVVRQRIDWWNRAFGVSVIGKTLIDVGCGTGRETKYFADYCEKVIAIDGSAKNVDTGGRKNIEVIEAVVPDTCLDGLRGDFVFCTNVLEHVDPEQIDRFIEYCRLFLEPNGHAFFSWSPVWSNIGSHTGNRSKWWEHIRYDKRGWDRHMRLEWGDSFADSWWEHEWRPGLSRRDWFGTEFYLTIEDVVKTFIKNGFRIKSHNIQILNEQENDLHVTRQYDYDFRDLAKQNTISDINFVCSSDTYFLGLP